jgi:hypothetical protein
MILSSELQSQLIPSDALNKVKYDVIFDPTLARTENASMCTEPGCSSTTFVFFQQHVDAGSMQVIQVCCNEKCRKARIK